MSRWGCAGSTSTSASTCFSSPGGVRLRHIVLMEAHGWIFTARLRWSQGAQCASGGRLPWRWRTQRRRHRFQLQFVSRTAAATAAEIEAKGRRVLSIRADQSQAEQVTALVDAAVGQLGRLDVLVNSASLWRRTPWAELDEAAWDQLLDINLEGPVPVRQSRHAAPGCARDGTIINIVDLSAGVPFPNLMPHSAAKAGLWNLTQALAMELAPAVRVNALRPAPCCRRPATPRSRSPPRAAPFWAAGAAPRTWPRRRSFWPSAVYHRRAAAGGRRRAARRLRAQADRQTGHRRNVRRR